nr:hypothetical protein [Tanacetum cinerariifolium]
MSFSKRLDSDAKPFPKSIEFNANDFAVLVGHPAPFWKFSEPFLCLVGMSRNYTQDEDTYPSILHNDRTVSPTRAESELEASVEKLFDEGGKTKQGDSTIDGGHDGASLRILDMAVEDIVSGNVTTKRPKRQCKKRRAVTNASGFSHPPKKLRGEHRTSSEAATGGKSSSVLKELLASSILNVEAGVEAVATLPLVNSSISATPERESGVPTDSVIGLNLRTIGPSERIVISSDSSHHSSTNAAEAGIDSFVRSVAPPPVMIKAVISTNVASIPSVPAPKTDTKVISLVHAFMFHDSDSTRAVRPDAVGSSHIPRKELSMGSWDINSETLHKVFVLQ